MRFQLVRYAVPFIAIGALAACAQKDDPGKGGAGSTGSAQGGAGSNATGTMSNTATGNTTSTSSSPDTTSSSTGGSGPGATGWTVVPLIEDTTDPNNTVERNGNDLVTGIRFASLDDGLITTTGSEQTFGEGGAIFKAKQKQVEKVLFGGNRDGLCELGGIDFHGIEKTADGFVGLAYACDIVASHDGGSTFGIASAQSGDQLGIEGVLAMRPRGNDTVIVADTGYVAKTPSVISANSSWTYTWAPEGNPTVPSPLPDNLCQGGPHSFVPTQHTSVYVSPDGNFMAYPASPNFDAQVCVSTDGGATFLPHVLPGVADDALDFTPSGVAFANATTGVVFWGTSIYPGDQYIYQTTDSGTTWTKVTVPAEVASKAVDLATAFYAPDGTHAWMLGYDYDAMVAFMLRSTDGGATWKYVTSDMGSKINGANGQKLFTGFALDENHIWVGGEYGILMSNDAGGD